MATTTARSVPTSTGGSISRDAGMKTRIISHMNADHASSLSLYLRHFCGVPSNQATNARMDDVTLEHMIIKSSAGRNLISFEPPMKSLAEARDRVVAMHQQALKGLDLSEIEITRYALPNNALRWVILFAAAWTFISFPFVSRLHPDSDSVIAKIWSVGGLVPSLAKTAHSTAPIVLPIMLITHLGETIYMIQGRLRRHQVPLGSTAWWLWVVNTFIAGVFCIGRFDDLVVAQEQAKKNEKH